jgi:hypothetical protein
MELKNVNPNDDNVVTSNMITSTSLFLRIVKIEFKNKDHMLFFLKDVTIVQKTKFLIFFNSLINIK